MINNIINNIPKHKHNTDTMTREQLEDELRNTILFLFECITGYSGIDDPDWIELICNEVGFTDEDYRKIMRI